MRNQQHILKTWTLNFHTNNINEIIKTTCREENIKITIFNEEIYK